MLYFFSLILIGDDERLIPQTSDRLISDFTSDERKTMYEYVIAHTVAPDIGQHDITDINKPEYVLIYLKINMPFTFLFFISFIFLLN